MLILKGDGIYDVLSNEEVIGIVWNTINSKQKLSIHEVMKFAAENIIKEALIKKSLDNVTALVICFSNLDFETRHQDQILAKPIMQSELKVQRRWNDFQDDERAQTERRRVSKSLKRVYRGQNILPFEDKIGGSAIEELSGLGRPNQSFKYLPVSPNIKFTKIVLDKRQLNLEVKPTIDFPKIAKLRTPR